MLDSGLDGGRFFGDGFMRVDQRRVDSYEMFLTLDEVSDLALIADSTGLSPQRVLEEIIKDGLTMDIKAIKAKET